MESRVLARITASIAAAVVCAALVGCASGDNAPKSTSEDSLRTVEPRFAYAVGLGMGRRLRDTMAEDGVTADQKLILRGVKDALENNPTMYPEDEMELAITRIEAAVRQRKAEKQYAVDASFRKLADENLRNSREAFARASNMDGVETLPSGLLLRVLKPGHGRFVAMARVLNANFTVSLADKTIVRSSEPGVPATVRVARLPSALAEALQEMRVGCKCQVALPPEKAFGLGGLPPVIGPNQALLVEFEIVEVQ